MKKRKNEHELINQEAERRRRQIWLCVIAFIIVVIVCASCKKDSSKCYDCAVKITGNDTIVCGRIPNNVQNCRSKE